MPRGVTVWFTGLPASGKSTIARRLEERLKELGLPVERLDGDTVRQSLTRDLGFSREDREQNIERVRFVAKLLTRNGVVVLAAFVSPFESMRSACRREIGDFLLIYVKASRATLLQRDVKGLYRKALAGQLQHFTGVDDPFEEPSDADLVLDTDHLSIEEAVHQVEELLAARGYLPSRVSAWAKALSPEPHAALFGHGGRLVDQVLSEAARCQALARAATLPAIRLDRQAQCDLELIAVGAMSPLTGFLGRQDYDCVVEHLRLMDGTVWPLPITLPVAAELAHALHLGEDAALLDEGGRLLALLRVEDVYPYDKEREARLVFGTTDPAHPGVARLLAQGEYYVGGTVWLVAHPEIPFAEHCLTPRATRQAFATRGWRRVVAFQTRNPVHRAHEYIQKTALETVDGLLFHPLIGWTKEDDVPAEIRLQSYRVLLAHYYPPERVLLAGFPAAMRYAGPREALFHALCRKNYGCTHFIVGRDHAGVGNYYRPYDAQRIFERFRPEEIGITVLSFENAFYCRRCNGMATTKTCPHPADAHLHLSGTEVRQLLRGGYRPPPEFTRPEVADVLLAALAEVPTSSEG